MGGLSTSVYYCVTSIEALSRVKLSNCTKCLMSTQHAVNSDWFQILLSYTHNVAACSYAVKLLYVLRFSGWLYVKFIS